MGEDLFDVLVYISFILVISFKILTIWFGFFVLMVYQSSWGYSMPKPFCRRIVEVLSNP